MKEDVGDARVDEENEDHWYLHLLAVHPDWQGKGVGSALLHWCVSKATEENVPLLLWSSVVVELFYRKHGFVPNMMLSRLVWSL